MIRTISRLALAGAALAPLMAFSWAVAQEKNEPMVLDNVKMSPPANWVRKEPRSRIINFEFAAPAAKGDATEGRFTVMSAGGGVEANIDRWIGQFTQPDGKSTKDRAKISKKTISGVDVHLVDISGTFKDQPAPFAPGVDREKYRMLAAIVIAKQGQFFLKFYGPEQTIADHEKAFATMIDGLKAE